jgi:hypothetical protein
VDVIDALSLEHEGEGAKGKTQNRNATGERRTDKGAVEKLSKERGSPVDVPTTQLFFV